MFEDMVDVASGKMTLKQGTDEVFKYMFSKQPDRLIMEIQLRVVDCLPGFYVTIWIPKKCFDEKC